MGERPGQKKDEGPVEAALASSVLGNATAFGYSIMITVSFGVLTRVRGEADVLDLFAFASAAALSVALIEGVLTRGFRRRLEALPAEVVMLGTAMHPVSVVAAVGVALAAAEALPELLGWFAAAFLASGAYVLLEGFEILLAQRIQAARGDPDAQPDR